MLSKLVIFWFRKSGWRFVGPLPKHSKKAVIVYAPHTSFKDILIGRAILKITSFETHIAVKKRYFLFPLSSLLKKWRCFPFEHESSDDFVQFVERGMASPSPFSITVPFHWQNESKSNEWLHDLALKYNAPIVAVAISAKSKTVKIHSHFSPSSNKKTEWQFIRTFLSRYNGSDRRRPYPSQSQRSVKM